MAGKKQQPRPEGSYMREDGTWVKPENEGLYQRKDGMWIAVLNYEDPQTGEKESKPFSSKNWEMALAKRAAFKKQLDDGLAIGGDKQTVAAFLAGWLEHQVKPNERPRTYDNYEQVCRCYIIPHIGKRTVRGLTADHVDQMMSALRQTTGRRGKPLSATTVGIARRILRIALNFAVRRRTVTYNVVTMTDAPKIVKPKLPKPTPEQGRLLLETVRGHRHEMLYRTGLMLGLRAGEALGLSWDDIDFAAETVTIRHALQRRKGFLGLVEPKTEQSRRTLPLPASLAVALKAHRARTEAERARSLAWKGNDWNLVFVSDLGTPLEPSNVTRHFKKMLKQAGLPDFRFHDLRGAFATALAVANLPVSVAQKSLGHSNSSQTLDVYTSVPQAALKPVADTMDRLYPYQPDPVAAAEDRLIAQG